MLVCTKSESLDSPLPPSPLYLFSFSYVFHADFSLAREEASSRVVSRRLHARCAGEISPSSSLRSAITLLYTAHKVESVNDKARRASFFLSHLFLTYRYRFIAREESSREPVFARFSSLATRSEKRDASAVPRLFPIILRWSTERLAISANRPEKTERERFAPRSPRVALSLAVTFAASLSVIRTGFLLARQRE